MRAVIRGRPCWRGLIAPCAALLLAACAPMQHVSREATPAVIRQAQPSFDLDGRLSATDGDRAASGRIEWKHDSQQDDWTAYSPLGQIVARLTSAPSGAELSLANGERHRAPGADRLLPALIGVDVPLARLPGWIQAAPQAGAEVRRLDPEGRPATVIDQGWRIDYTEYTDTAAQALPRRIEISRGDARIRLVIDRWSLLP